MPRRWLHGLLAPCEGSSAVGPPDKEPARPLVPETSPDEAQEVRHPPGTPESGLTDYRGTSFSLSDQWLIHKCVFPGHGHPGPIYLPSGLPSLLPLSNHRCTVPSTPGETEGQRGGRGWGRAGPSYCLSEGEPVGTAPRPKAPRVAPASGSPSPLREHRPLPLPAPGFPPPPQPRCASGLGLAPPPFHQTFPDPVLSPGDTDPRPQP